MKRRHQSVAAWLDDVNLGRMPLIRVLVAVTAVGYALRAVTVGSIGILGWAATAGALAFLLWPGMWREPSSHDEGR